MGGVDQESEGGNVGSRGFPKKDLATVFIKFMRSITKENAGFSQALEKSGISMKV